MSNVEDKKIKLIKESDAKTRALDDNELEEIESFNIYEYYEIYNQLYFENLLSTVTLKWSKRMTSCAGTFQVSKNIPEIHLSEPLLKYRSIKEIRETLLHEMIHAYIFVKNLDISDDLSGHGKHFKDKMNQINKETGLNITIYHSFHNEVNLYSKYIWRCNGPCRHKPPYFGFVRRQMNRPPQKADKWFDSHQKSCGGTFIRISPTDEELEKSKKIKKKDKKTKKSQKSQKNNKIPYQTDEYITNDKHNLFDKWLTNTEDLKHSKKLNKSFNDDKNFEIKNKIINANLDSNFWFPSQIHVNHSSKKRIFGD